MADTNGKLPAELVGASRDEVVAYVSKLTAKSIAAIQSLVTSNPTQYGEKLTEVLTNAAARVETFVVLVRKTATDAKTQDRKGSKARTNSQVQVFVSV